MFHRIAVIWLLSAGLGLAGVPAAACCDATAPIRDCCPGQQSGQGSPISSGASVAAVCCTAAATQPATTNAQAGTPQTRKYPPHPDPMTLIAWPILAVSDHTSPSSEVCSAAPAYYPSQSKLYLTSGHLRL